MLRCTCDSEVQQIQYRVSRTACSGVTVHKGRIEAAELLVVGSLYIRVG